MSRKCRFIATCAAWLLDRRVEDAAEVQAVEAGDEQHRRDDRVGEEPRHPLCSAARSHSRGPGGSPSPAAGSARSASVTGAPSTSRIGTSIDSSMCAAMCMLNIAGM